MEEEKETGQDETKETVVESEKQATEDSLPELNNKYLRLYADFENYKKRVQKDREELVKYGNESLLYELLTVFDNLEMALKHASNNSVSDGILKGVEITLRELRRVTEKFGLSPIEALYKPFDPSLHHAMTQVERDDVEGKTVIEEFRKGYTLGNKVLRPSMVAVSRRPEAPEEDADNDVINIEVEEE